MGPTESLEVEEVLKLKKNTILNANALRAATGNFLENQ